LSERTAIVVYSERGSLLYRELARRIHATLIEDGSVAELRSSLEPIRHEEVSLLLVIGPCSGTKLPPAHRRIIVLSEALDSIRQNGLRKALSSFDAAFDIGFVPQKERYLLPDVPYCFIPDVPTMNELSALARVRPSERSLPWALFGLHRDAAEATLVHELVQLDPGGFAYMPQAQLLRKGAETAKPATFAAVASKARYYIWHCGSGSAPCESAHYRRALLGGAVPCRLGDEVLTGIPGSYSSVQELCAEMRNGDPYKLYETALNFYISRGSLSEHLEKALASV
jgi:hypothetical protein